MVKRTGHLLRLNLCLGCPKGSCQLKRWCVLLGNQQWRPIANWPVFAQALPRSPQAPSPLPPVAPRSQHWPQPAITSATTNQGGTPLNRYAPEILELAQAHKQFTIGIGVIVLLYFLVINLLGNSNLWVLGYCF